MDQQNPSLPTETPAIPTSPKRAPTGVFSAPPKRPATRSNSKLATDYLLEENRIGLEVHRPHKKRRYVSLNLARMMPALVTLYSFLFKVNWTHFRHAESKFPVKHTGITIFESFAIVYLSHWLHDLYRINRKCLESLDPVAFAEKYYHQVGTYSEVYDNFLSLLASHIRPTHITNNYADDIYIPVATTRESPNPLGQLIFAWDRYVLDSDLFYLIVQTLDIKKLTKMTPLSSDLLGRPSWLFDWAQDNTVYSWFPQEGNYNDEDVSVAYVIGDACTPKLGHADIDDWKYTKAASVDLRTQSVIDSYKRVNPRRWYACAEFRTAEVEEVNLPRFHEKDDAAFRASNTGPIQLVDNILSKLSIASSSTDEAEITEGIVDSTTVPPSPRYATRHQVQATTERAFRTRVTDRLYYNQVIKYFDLTSRLTAFKLFTKYD